jgi:hypothetical protein
MAHAIKIAALSATAAAQAIGARLNSGTINFYTGTQPATADTATAETLLATCTFSANAVDSTTDGVATIDTITKDSDADATGTAAWFRCLTSGAAAVMDGTVGVGTGYDCNVPTTSVVQHAEFSVTSMTLTMPLE